MDKPSGESIFSTIGKALIHTTRRRFHLCDLKLEQLKLCPGQLPVLGELNRHQHLTQRRLAELTRVTPATISGTLKRMERAGLVQRSSDEADARVSIVTLTQKGMDCSEEAVRLFTQTDMEMLDGFSEEEMAQLLNYLQRMSDNVNRSLEAATKSNRTDGDAR